LWFHGRLQSRNDGARQTGADGNERVRPIVPQFGIGAPLGSYDTRSGRPLKPKHRGADGLTIGALEKLHAVHCRPRRIVGAGFSSPDS
jgi:hypothetical protein